MNKFYITTAIDYVNSNPHLGTAYEKIGADAIARYKRRQGCDTFFLMGTDEHSLNVERQAKASGVTPIQYCDKMITKFKDVWSRLNISFDDFIRTTEKRHIKTVQDFIQKIHDKGDIYKNKYKGWYCVSCEAFLKEKDLVDKKCPTHGKEPQWVEEDNYFFSLSKYQKPLLSLLEKNPEFIRPKVRLNEIKNVIEGGLEDISITRSSVGWGIPVPFDPDNVIYVWFDALINYVSGIGFADNKKRFQKYWPCDLHVIGKDITRFHCIIWPAMLMSAGIELPKKVWGHGFVHMGGEKMSKTLGTSIDPMDLIDKYGADSVRYFLLREVPFDRDGEFTIDKFLSRYKSDLANDLGNLLHRVLNMINRYNKGLIIKADNPVTDLDKDLLNVVASSVSLYEGQMEEYKLSNALSSIWNMIKRANRYVEETSPWALNKEKNFARLQSVLYNLAETLRIVSIVLEPFMPQTAKSIWEQLGNPGNWEKQSIKEAKEWGKMQNEFPIGKALPLFPRID